MISSRRLAPLLHRALEQQNAAARQLAERQRLLAAHESRLGELNRYADDYATGLPAVARAGQLHGQRAFLGRVHTALEQQRQTVDDTHQEVEHGREHWRTAYRNTQVIEHLRARSHAAERAHEQRREQRTLDELGTRRFCGAAPDQRTSPAGRGNGHSATPISFGGKDEALPARAMLHHEESR